MKTAMQFIKDEIESKIIPSSRKNGELTDYQYGHNVAYGVVLTIIEYALEKEKEQIKRAFEFGIADAYNFIEDDAEQYYNETYNK
jgi:hypothetical protein